MNVFLSCTKEKASSRCKAKDMYMPSSLFEKSYNYAKDILKADHIYILSAKHHLLGLNEEIEPYNETLNDASVEERKQWTEEVLKQMKSRHIDFNAKTYFLCGENYIEFLEEHFKDSKSLYKGKGIGEIMHWLDKKLGNKTNECLSLKEYIRESLSLDMKLNETSLLDDFDTINSKTDIMFLDKVKEFITTNYNIRAYGRAAVLNISAHPNKDGKYEVDVMGDVHVRDSRRFKLRSLTNDYFVWNKVTGAFDCWKCISLKSLEGAPKEVNLFNCENCNSLTNLEGAPEKVHTNFYCSECKSLKSLKGAPKEVMGSFMCIFCPSLTTLEGAPKEVGVNFDCWGCKSLKDYNIDTRIGGKLRLNRFE